MVVDLYFKEDVSGCMLQLAGKTMQSGPGTWDLKPGTVSMYRLARPHLLCCILNRLHNIVIPRATAEVSFQRMPDRFFRGLRVVLQQIGRHHDHARRTETALQPVAFVKTFLQRMQFAVVRQAFDSGYFTTIGLNGQHGAAFGRLSVYMYGAGATTAGIAAYMGAG